MKDPQCYCSHTYLPAVCRQVQPQRHWTEILRVKTCCFLSPTYITPPKFHTYLWRRSPILGTGFCLCFVPHKTCLQASKRNAAPLFVWPCVNLIPDLELNSYLKAEQRGVKVICCKNSAAAKDMPQLLESLSFYFAIWKLPGIMFQFSMEVTALTHAFPQADLPAVKNCQRWKARARVEVRRAATHFDAVPINQLASIEVGRWPRADLWVHPVLLWEHHHRPFSLQMQCLKKLSNKDIGCQSSIKTPYPN